MSDMWIQCKKSSNNYSAHAIRDLCYVINNTKPSFQSSEKWLQLLLETFIERRGLVVVKLAESQSGVCAHFLLCLIKFARDLQKQFSIADPNYESWNFLRDHSTTSMHFFPTFIGKQDVIVRLESPCPPPPSAAATRVVVVLQRLQKFLDFLFCCCSHLMKHCIFTIS